MSGDGIDSFFSALVSVLPASHCGHAVDFGVVRRAVQPPKPSPPPYKCARVRTSLMVVNTRRLGQRSLKLVNRFLRYRDFFKWRLSAILDLLGGNMDDPRRVLGGHYCCAKFG